MSRKYFDARILNDVGLLNWHNWYMRAIDAIVSLVIAEGWKW